MEKLSAPEELINEVSDIIGHHHHPRKEESLNFKAVFDADLIENLEDRIKVKNINQDKISIVIERAFLTQAGKNHAKNILL